RGRGGRFRSREWRARRQRRARCDPPPSDPAAAPSAPDASTSRSRIRFFLVALLAPRNRWRRARRGLTGAGRLVAPRLAVASLPGGWWLVAPWSIAARATGRLVRLPRPVATRRGARRFGAPRPIARWLVAPGTIASGSIAGRLPAPGLRLPRLSIRPRSGRFRLPRSIALRPGVARRFVAPWPLAWWLVAPGPVARRLVAPRTIACWWPFARWCVAPGSIAARPITGRLAAP